MVPQSCIMRFQLSRRGSWFLNALDDQLPFPSPRKTENQNPGRHDTVLARPESRAAAQIPLNHRLQCTTPSRFHRGQAPPGRIYIEGFEGAILT